MKKLILITLWIIPLSAQSQTFDSIAYQNHYNERFSSGWYGDTLDVKTKIAGLSRAWAEAKWNFANFDLVPNLNWDSLYQSFIPAVTERLSMVEYYKELMRFYHHLNDGHSLIFVPEAFKDSVYAYIPIRCQLHDGKIIIKEHLNQDYDYTYLAPGNIIQRINGLTPENYITKFVAPYAGFSTTQDSIARIMSFYLTRGSLSEPLELTLLKPGGEVVTKDFSRRSLTGFFPAFEGFSYEALDSKTKILRINTFNDSSLIPFIDSIFQTTKHPENLIIDLRKNGGGNSGYGFELLGYLSHRNINSGNSAIRKYQPAMRAWGLPPDEIDFIRSKWSPYKSPTYTGNVIVLTGPDTYSAAEDFLIAFKELNRGILIGQTTGGSTGQPLFFPLPGGGLGAVCSKRELMIDGTEFIGTGIEPDMYIQYSYDHFLEGKDDAIIAAMEYIRALK
ncbi:MAG: S41 family peptidase [Cyclobacteriaceae bacterium]|nr:S41 family peptidase [Cyclobacteriaceae bacterium]